MLEKSSKKVTMLERLGGEVTILEKFGKKEKTILSDFKLKGCSPRFPRGDLTIRVIGY
jgi:hypothetical protein